MKKIILFFVILFCNCMNSQVSRLHFNYDASGNQEKRYLKLNSLFEKQSNEVFKDDIELIDEDLLKFYKEDFLSYYPNPVKEQLFIKWELINETKISFLTLLNINGQQIKTISELEGVDSVSVSFVDLPSGTYFILLNYTDGKQESIKILKP